METKDETIALRIKSDLKEDFQLICENEQTDMSTKLHQFINKEVQTKKVPDINEQIENLFIALGYNNVSIISLPYNSAGLNTQTYRINEERTLTDFINQHQDKHIDLFFSGSKLPEEFRSIVY